MSKRRALRAVKLLLSVALYAPFAGAQSAPRRAPSTPRAAQSGPTRENTEPPPAPRQRDISPEEADLAITARVTARSLRFDAVPNPKVEFTGRPRRETAWDAERTNLPRPVQPGVTYRDIGIRLKIVSVFADIDRIVAEALGEVPPADGAPQVPGALPPEGATGETANMSAAVEKNHALASDAAAATVGHEMGAALERAASSRRHTTRRETEARPARRPRWGAR